AEDGIRDGHVTGVQTCALPIFKRARFRSTAQARGLQLRRHRPRRSQGMSRIILSAAAALAVAALVVPAAMAVSSSTPVAIVNSAKFGKVLATAKGHLAFYTWTREKDNKVHCTGACAKVWPPILVP